MRSQVLFAWLCVWQCFWQFPAEHRPLLRLHPLPDRLHRPLLRLHPLPHRLNPGAFMNLNPGAFGRMFRALSAFW